MSLGEGNAPEDELKSAIDWVRRAYEPAVCASIPGDLKCQWGLSMAELRFVLRGGHQSMLFGPYQSLQSLIPVHAGLRRDVDDEGD